MEFGITNDLKLNIRINHAIAAKEIRLVGMDGSMLGVTTVEDGIRAARRSGLDLVEISPNASPPVCKILDYGKYRYELQKKAQEVKKKQKVVEVKEIKLRPNIASGDYDVKVRNIKKFLSDGNKVKVCLIFRGREITHSELGYAVIERLKLDLTDVAKIEVEPKLEGKQIFMLLCPKSN